MSTLLMLLSAFDVHDGHRLYPDLRVIMEVCLSLSCGVAAPQLPEISYPQRISYADCRLHIWFSLAVFISLVTQFRTPCNASHIFLRQMAASSQGLDSFGKLCHSHLPPFYITLPFGNVCTYILALPFGSVNTQNGVDAMDFPTRLKKLRTDHHLTQKQVYEAIGMSSLGYQRYEYGERKPSFDMLIALADCFDVSIDYLVGRTDNPKINR